VCDGAPAAWMWAPTEPRGTEAAGSGTGRNRWPGGGRAEDTAGAEEAAADEADGDTEAGSAEAVGRADGEADSEEADGEAEEARGRFFEAGRPGTSETSAAAGPVASTNCCSTAARRSEEVAHPAVARWITT